MLNHIKRKSVPITIGVSFFVFGFFITANLLRLSESEVLVGLCSGAVAGLIILIASLLTERRSHNVATRTV
jgi:hypothetical protein